MKPTPVSAATASNVSQSQFWTPIEDQFCAPVDTEFAVTYLNEKALPFVQPVAEALGALIVVPCDVRISGQLEAVFARIERDWGQLDFLLHSIAFAA